MSKMSNLALELDELAVELGFEDLEDAMNNGYEWVQDDNDEPHLVKIEDEQNKAHEAWLKERDHALEILDLVADTLRAINNGLMKTAGGEGLVEIWTLMELSRETQGVAKFIKEQCHD